MVLRRKMRLLKGQILFSVSITQGGRAREWTAVWEIHTYSLWALCTPYQSYSCILYPGLCTCVKRRFQMSQTFEVKFLQNIENTGLVIHDSVKLNSLGISNQNAHSYGCWNQNIAIPKNSPNFICLIENFLLAFKKLKFSCWFIHIQLPSKPTTDIVLTRCCGTKLTFAEPTTFLFNSIHFN